MREREDYLGTTSSPPVPFTNRTTEAHKGAGKGKDIRTRQHTIAITPCIVTKADGTTYEISRTASRKTTKRKVTAQREISEFAKLGEKVHNNLSLDEIRARNGL